jgi:hypothetical protein
LIFKQKKQLLDFSITTMVNNYWACKRSTHASSSFFFFNVGGGCIDMEKKVHACKLKLVVSSEPGHLGPHVWFVFFVMWCIFQFILRCWIFIGFFFNVILQCMVDFELIFMIYFSLISIKLLWSQTNILISDWCLIFVSVYFFFE